MFAEVIGRLKNSAEFCAVLCREPYRIFFPLGIVMGMLGTGHWLFYAKGWIPQYSGFFHSSLQMLTYMNSLILGFLLTAMPRFSKTAPSNSREVSFFLLTTIGIALFLSLGQWIAAQACYLLWLGALVRFFLKRVKQRAKDQSAEEGAPRSLIWVPLGVLSGMIGTLLLLAGQLGWLPGWALLAGKPMMEQGLLLAVVIGVGGFLAPRLMGTYEKAQDCGKVCEGKKPHPVGQPGVRTHLILGALFLLSFIPEGLGGTSLAYGLRALVLSAGFFLMRCLSFPRTKEFYVRLLWISLWMIVVGFWGAAIFPDYRILMLHLAFIGGFSLMTFAVATMVVLSHAGEYESLKRPLWILWAVAIGLGLSLIKRVLVAFWPDFYFQFLGISAVLWMAAAGLWLSLMVPRLLKVPEADEFERMHEQAKQKIAQTLQRHSLG